MKTVLTTASALGYPGPDQTHILDAKDVGMGAGLSQIQDGEERVITYFSNTLTLPE